MRNIDPTAIVKKEAEIGDNVSIGPFSIIEKNVIIGENTKIGSGVVISSGTSIGKGCNIFHGAVLGTIPQDLKFTGEETILRIGDNTTIREYATINRGTKYSGKTVVGKNCLVMAYVHIAHDCVIKDNVILANAVNMAGHVEIDDFAIVGGIVPIHQFVKIGKHSFIGGGYRVPKDVPPYILAAEEPLTYCGLNIVGLKRRGFSREAIEIIKKVYKFIYRSSLNVSQALEIIEKEIEKTKEVNEIVRFIKSSKRGIIK
ncbi:acyl-[acyl-carrier-protein]--UDP-N-acetylglucosamine O-acyltransferase [candidate division KSB1 bacterium]|nr:MAG: acyl-[acyl-carrier-protein]--UDP-N-acetylglucosamine O-acyltransferase [candidate division KSB1 bacterium]